MRALTSFLKRFYNLHKRYISASFFLGGVAYDSLTLRRIDQMSDNLVLLGYILVLGALAVLVGRLQNGQIQHPRIRRYAEFYPLVIQFLLGNLFSAYTVYYFQSASLTKTAIFFGILVVLLVVNEMIEKRLANLPLLITLYFFAAFSFFIFFIPVLTGVMNRWMFLLGAILSLLLVVGVLGLIFRGFSRHQRDLVRSAVSVGGLFAVLLLFYSMNWIPPVPLSLKFGGIYYTVSKEGTVYHLTFSKPPWYHFWKASEDLFRFAPGQRVYCFTSVFAPTAMKSNIFHEWQRYDERRQEWVRTDRSGYPVTGGRGGGYRGYTYKHAISPGRWRVDVQTPEGLLLGRVKFRAVEGDKGDLALVTIDR